MNDAVIGKEVDGYHIEAVLGRGGMGVVYKAEDIALSRPVALKRINPAQAHREQFLRRFRSEAKALARINSPYITSIYALRDTDIGLLIVMEYVDGGTLKDWIDEGPMPPHEVIPIVRQMLHAFRDAHGAGVIHRDIKPQNVLRASDGTVKITDFGIAKLRRPDSGETVTQGGQGGTLKYMSPEQIEKIDEVDNRSDLYALGMTMYEMLAGRLPFGNLDTDFDIMRKVVSGSVTPPGEFISNLPPDLASVIEEATATKPTDRFASAETMLEALDRAADAIERAGSQAMWDVDADRSNAEPEGDTETETATATEDADDATILDDSLLDEIDDVAAQESAAADPVPASAPPSDWTIAADPRDGASRRTADVTQPASGSGVPVIGIVGAVVTLLIILGGAYVYFMDRPSSLALATTPAGAVVELDGDSIGVTPIDAYAVEPGTYAVEIRKEGHVPVDTFLAVEDGQSLAVSGIRLDARTAQLAVATTPPGARVMLGSRELGRTPIDGVDIPARTAVLRVEKEGYAALDTTVQFTSGEPVRLDNLQLVESASGASGAGEPSSADRVASRDPDPPVANRPSTPEPAPSARLRVDAASDVRVSVDGQPLGRPGTYDVSAGTRTVACVHPEHGTIDRRVTLSGNATETLTCVFEHDLVVTNANGSKWGNVWIDGRNTEVRTPGAQFTLTPGRYRVEMRVQRDPNVSVQGGTYRRTAVEDDAVETQRDFAQPSYELVIEPGFQKYNHVLVFRTNS